MSGPGVAARLLGNARFEIVPSGGVEAELRHLAPGTTVTVTCSPRRGIDRTWSSQSASRPGGSGPYPTSRPAW